MLKQLDSTQLLETVKLIKSQSPRYSIADVVKINLETPIRKGNFILTEEIECVVVGVKLEHGSEKYMFIYTFAPICPLIGGPRVSDTYFEMTDYQIEQSLTNNGGSINFRIS